MLKNIFIFVQLLNSTGSKAIKNFIGISEQNPYPEPCREIGGVLCFCKIDFNNLIKMDGYWNRQITLLNDMFGCGTLSSISLNKCDELNRLNKYLLGVRGTFLLTFHKLESNLLNIV